MERKGLALYILGCSIAKPLNEISKKFGPRNRTGKLQRRVRSSVFPPRMEGHGYVKRGTGLLGLEHCRGE